MSTNAPNRPQQSNVQIRQCIVCGEWSKVEKMFITIISAEYDGAHYRDEQKALLCKNCLDKINDNSNL